MAIRAVAPCEDVHAGTGKEGEAGVVHHTWMTGSPRFDDGVVLAIHGGIAVEIGCLIATETARWTAIACSNENETGISAREIGIVTKTDENDLTDGMTGILGAPIVRTGTGL